MNSSQNSLLNKCKDCKDFLDRLLISIPLFIKIIICSTIILYIVNILIPISFIISDIPYYTIYYFQIWRLVTTSFMATNISFILPIFSTSHQDLPYQSGFHLVFITQFFQIVYKCTTRYNHK
jgi:hypothetical protein